MRVYAGHAGQNSACRHMHVCEYMLVRTVAFTRVYASRNSALHTGQNSPALYIFFQLGRSLIASQNTANLLSLRPCTG